MTAVHLESIDRTVQVTHHWINELNEMLGWSDRSRAYRLLKAVLQALRDWLPVHDSADFADELPNLLRGVYFEHWHPDTTPVEQRDDASFLARVDAAFADDPLADTAEAVALVFTLLSHEMSPGEVAEVRRALPADLRALWSVPPRVH